jgi:hypothetical protein
MSSHPCRQLCRPALTFLAAPASPLFLSAPWPVVLDFWIPIADGVE